MIYNDSNKPQKGERWTIGYGINKKSIKIVRVAEDKKLQFKNWRVHDFVCFIDGGYITISGMCFLDKLY